MFFFCCESLIYKTKSLKNVLQYTEGYYRTMQKGGGIAPPVKILTAQLHHAVFHSRVVMLDGKLFVFHAQAVA